MQEVGQLEGSILRPYGSRGLMVHWGTTEGKVAHVGSRAKDNLGSPLLLEQAQPLSPGPRRWSLNDGSLVMEWLKSVMFWQPLLLTIWNKIWEEAI